MEHLEGVELVAEIVAGLALTMQYKGLQRTSALPLTDDGLEQLIIEAQVRDMSVGQFVSTLIRAMMKRGLCRVLDAEHSRKTRKSNGT